MVTVDGLLARSLTQTSRRIKKPSTRYEEGNGVHAAMVCSAMRRRCTALRCAVAGVSKGPREGTKEVGTSVRGGRQAARRTR
jgi:hypothetical protein